METHVLFLNRSEKLFACSSGAEKPFSPGWLIISFCALEDEKESSNSSVLAQQEPNQCVSGQSCLQQNWI